MDQQNHLLLSRCPHCSVARPLLECKHKFITTNQAGGRQRMWVVYECSSCGGVVTTASRGNSLGHVDEMFPTARIAHADIPDRARQYLTQAIESAHAPAGSIMLAASSVDAMLKAVGFVKGSLYARIDEAAANHAVTAEMARWAHEVRLDANDQRHSDEEAPLPTAADAERAVEFVQALGQFLFVLPAVVARGRAQGEQGHGSDG